ncbi:putative transmembrane efflux protein [Phycicoccus elongatus Lp2]|uniref:Putative transmembrane efflux protein n=1 Tax=Phycicoccus elongatus Lp2 TaxID=1193181 RepID=N0DYS9_9MICO|nr:MFS transporter [Phycicoccus elongatus]CCH69622.1 putative transmembrane efflux protein [Phycicoccus elongatus Lp2]
MTTTVDTRPTTTVPAEGATPPSGGDTAYAPTNSAPDRAARHGALPTGRARTIALLSLFLASTMELLDTTIVNVALPTIERGLAASPAQLQWMVAAYPLAFAVGLITGSRLGDLIGRKRVFVGGLVGFTLMSAACGFAPNAEALVGFRALQGLAAAAMIPQVLSSLQVMYRPDERAKAMGMFTGLAGVSTVLGPVLGALLTEADLAGLGWRAIFLVNVPVGVLALAAALRWVPESVAAQRPPIDLRGVVMLAVGLLAVLYPLTLGRELGWPTWLYAVMAAGLLVLVAFVRTQWRAERSGREPLVALSLYRERGFAAGSALNAVLFLAMSAYFLCQTIYLQAGLGWSVLKAGLVGVPFAVTTAVMAGFGVVVLAPRIGRRVLQLGALTWAAGAGLLWVTVAGADGSTSVWAFLPGLVVAGAGSGLMVAPIGVFTLAGVPVTKAGSASGLSQPTGQLSAATGIAIVGSVYFSIVDAQARHGAQVPVDLFRPAMLAALGVLVALMLGAAVVAHFLPPRLPEAPSDLPVH